MTVTSNPLESEEIKGLCIQSFQKSGMHWYRQYATLVENFNTEGIKIVDHALERIRIAEAENEFYDGVRVRVVDDGEVEDGQTAHELQIKFYEDKMPSAEEAKLWLRDIIKPFERPRRRGRGVTNWEKVQVIKSDAFKVCLLKMMRVVNAYDYAVLKCTERAENVTPDVDFFADNSEAWGIRAQALEDCEDPADFMPGSEEISTWLEQIEGRDLLEKMEPFVALDCA